MIVYELYCIDEDRGTLYLKRDAAQADGITYIKTVGHSEIGMIPIFKML